jgi:hypothetical protein
MATVTTGKSAPVSETETWQPARLIPTAGIRGREEQEKRATSCLLAVMHAVPEFGHALLNELGAPKSPVIETFAEVRFKDHTGKIVSPMARSSASEARSAGPVSSRSRRGPRP